MYKYLSRSVGKPTFPKNLNGNINSWPIPQQFKLKRQVILINLHISSLHLSPWLCQLGMQCTPEQSLSHKLNFGKRVPYGMLVLICHYLLEFL